MNCLLVSQSVGGQICKREGEREREEESADRNCLVYTLDGYSYGYKLV